jgi:hypothetical protein
VKSRREASVAECRRFSREFEGLAIWLHATRARAEISCSTSARRSQMAGQRETIDLGMHDLEQSTFDQLLARSASPSARTIRPVEGRDRRRSSGKGMTGSPMNRGRALMLRSNPFQTTPARGSSPGAGGFWNGFDRNSPLGPFLHRGGDLTESASRPQ